MVFDGLTINPGGITPVNPNQPETPNTSAPPVQQQKAQKETQPPPTEEQSFDAEALAQLAEELNEEFRIFNASISFSVDKDTQTTVIKILDRDTEEVIREIPPEELLSLAAKLTEVIGRVVDKKV